MGFATVYCDKCGSQILGSELEKGSAAARGDKYYCAECSPSLPPIAPGGPPGERKGSTKIKRPGETRNTDIMRNLQAMGGTRGNTVRMPAVEPPSEGLGTGAKVGLSVVGLVVLILIGVMVSSRGGGTNTSGPGGSKPDASRARQAVEAAEALKGGTDARAWLEAAQKAKREASGTEFEDRAGEQVRQAQAALEVQEKADALTSEAKRLAADARAAEDPFTYEGAFRDLMARARKDAPPLEAQLTTWWTEIVQSALLKQVGRVDISMAGTAPGYRRAKDDLDEIAKKAASAGAAGKTAAEQVAKKLKEAEEKFMAGAEAALADLETRVGKMLDDMALEEADRAVTMFLSDYAGTAIAAKAAPLRDKVAAKKKELDNSPWIEPAEADWTKEGADGKFSWSGKEISFTSDGPPGSTTPETDPDKSRRIILKSADANWKDYDLEFEVFIEEHGGTLVVRGGGDNKNAHLLNFMPQNAQGVGLPKNQWFKLTTKVAGNKLKIGVGNGALQEFATTSVSGTIMFIGYKGSKFKIRNVRIRRLR